MHFDQHPQLTRPALSDITFDMIAYGADRRAFICGYNGDGQTAPLDVLAIRDLPDILEDLLSHADEIGTIDMVEGTEQEMIGFVHDGRKYGVGKGMIGPIEVLQIINLSHGPSRLVFDEIDREAERRAELVVREKVRELRAAIAKERKAAASRRGKLN